MVVDPRQILEILRRVARGKGFTPLHEPQFAGREWAYVKECIDTNWVSSAGSYVEQFETRLADVCGTKHAVALVNGTSALRICFVIGGAKSDEEIILPALTFVATATAAAYVGAVPHLADSEPETLGLDAAKLKAHLGRIAKSDGKSTVNHETGGRIAIIVPMHTFGHPYDTDAISSMAHAFGIPVIEDAAESVGSYYRGRSCGLLGLLSALSFNGNKILTSGSGGAILTNDENLTRRAKHLSTTAKFPHAWDFNHDEVGWNYRLPNINAALGVAQLKQMPGFVAAKRKLARKWQEAFAGIDGVSVFVPPTCAESGHWLTALILSPQSRHLRDDILALTNAAGVMTRPVWKLIHHLPVFENCPRMNLDAATDLAQSIINILSSAKHSFANAA
ncbi:MAG: LegC family aminotransferase [Aestuariivirga sp.]